MKTLLGRRHLLVGTAGMLGAGLLLAGRARPALAQTEPAPAQPEQAPFGFETVRERARQLAQAAFADPKGDVPEILKELDYDDYRRLRYRRDQALWRGESLFEVQFFHLGFYYDRAITISVVENGQATPVAYDPSNFDYGDAINGADLPADLGYAGFRIHFPLHRPDYADELAVFLGASYFRVLGRDQHYGLSARGLAIDTAAPSGEEFPFFREFWLEKPARDATKITVYALLDSRRATGAYRFVLTPGAATTVEVTAAIFARGDIEKIGIAPLTSMFLFGENRGRSFDDFRPEVHDSDGLLMLNGYGEWIWRPLVNPRNLRISSFVDENPRAFGLFQRDRDFDHYQDLEAEYQQRPSLWIEPRGDWGKGQVQLVEIPTDAEINDNVVVFWKPEGLLRAGEQMEVSYLMTSLLDRHDLPPIGRVSGTRIGPPPPGGPNGDVPPGARRFIVDFAGGELPGIHADQPVQAILTASNGAFTEPVVQKNVETGGWRTFFTFMPEKERAVDFRLYLRLRDSVITETWSYLWSP